jgi:hypothetical protein
MARVRNDSTNRLRYYLSHMEKHRQSGRYNVDVILDTARKFNVDSEDRDVVDDLVMMYVLEAPEKVRRYLDNDDYGQALKMIRNVEKYSEELGYEIPEGMIELRKKAYTAAFLEKIKVAESNLATAKRYAQEGDIGTDLEFRIV